MTEMRWKYLERMGPGHITFRAETDTTRAAHPPIVLWSFPPAINAACPKGMVSSEWAPMRRTISICGNQLDPHTLQDLPDHP